MGTRRPVRKRAGWPGITQPRLPQGQRTRPPRRPRPSEEGPERRRAGVAARLKRTGRARRRSLPGNAVACSQAPGVRVSAYSNAAGCRRSPPRDSLSPFPAELTDHVPAPQGQVSSSVTTPHTHQRTEVPPQHSAPLDDEDAAAEAVGTARAEPGASHAGPPAPSSPEAGARTGCRNQKTHHTGPRGESSTERNAASHFVMKKRINPTHNGHPHHL